MDRRVAFVTGAGGEMGRLLVPALVSSGWDVVAIDLRELPETTRDACVETAALDILDRDALAALVQRYRPERVFHLAAVLSSHAERDPGLAHHVNVGGTLGLLKICRERAGHPVRFMFPSSIAVYGLPDVPTKTREGALREWQWLEPTGMYGCNKLYCELVGTYQTRRPEVHSGEPIDFRSIRFPGLISAESLPSGGTTDFAPEMIHAAARGEAYDCFVREDSRLPFMTMPDAIDALLQLSTADAASLTTRVYNIRGFSCSAGEIRREVLRHFPEATIGFAPTAERQAIVDSWPADIDDTRARRDWGLSPRHGMADAFGEYLIPALRDRAATDA